MTTLKIRCAVAYYLAFYMRAAGTHVRAYTRALPGQADHD